MLRWPSYVLGEVSRRGRTATEAGLLADGLSLRGFFVLVCTVELPSASQQQIAAAWPSRLGEDTEPAGA